MNTMKRLFMIVQLFVVPTFLIAVGDFDEIAQQQVATLRQQAKKDRGAHTDLGLKYLYGLGTVRNYSEAYKQFELSKTVEGLCYMGIMNILGSGMLSCAQGMSQLAHVSKEYNDKLATLLLETLPKNLPDLSPHEYAMQIFLASRLFFQPDAEHCLVRASIFIEKAAQQGSAYAQYELSTMLYTGVAYPKDEKKALGWLIKAADQNLPEAVLSLGMRYMRGDGVKTDIPHAATLIKQVAENDANGDVVQGHALCLLACLWQEGYNEQGSPVEKNFIQAFERFKRAADKGSTAAKFNLAGYYTSGLGGEHNEERARQLYTEILGLTLEKEKGSLVDISNELFFQSLIYEGGLVDQPDTSRALELLKRAAEQGSDLAQEKLHLLVAQELQQEPEIKKKSRKKKKSTQGGFENLSVDEASSSIQEVPEVEAVQEIDIAGYQLRQKFNALPRTDESRVTAIDFAKKLITLDSDQFQVKLTFNGYHPARKDALSEFVYDIRIKKNFTDYAADKKQGKTPEESLLRHVFPAMVDLVMTVFSDKGIFFDEIKKRIVESLVLSGELTYKPTGLVMPGTFEYSFYKEGDQKVLFHRFCALKSKIVKR